MGARRFRVGPSIVCQPGEGKQKKDDGEEGEPIEGGYAPSGDKEPEIVQ